jgi:cytochrome c
VTINIFYYKEAVVKTRNLAAVIAVLSVSATAFAAADGEALFNSKKCNSCHKLDAKSVGPSMKAISAKYAEDKGAPAKLEAKVRAGGAGEWGTMPMPRVPASTASDEEVKIIVAWMLPHK